MAKPIKTRNNNEWTESRYNSFIKGGLRSASQRWPPKYSVLNAACVGQRINPKSGRLAKHYTCKNCGDAFPAKEVEIDHIDPVIGPAGFISWDLVIEKMFCEAGNLQVLCKVCHVAKTNKERSKRNEG